MRSPFKTIAWPSGFFGPLSASLWLLYIPLHTLSGTLGNCSESHRDPVLSSPSELQYLTAGGQWPAVRSFTTSEYLATPKTVARTHPGSSVRSAAIASTLACKKDSKQVCRPDQHPR